MASDLFGGLGGLVKGLSGLMPQDDPNIKMIAAQTELSDLKKNETEIFAEIGRKVMAESPGSYPDAADRLRLIQSNIVQLEGDLKTAQAAKDEAEQAKKEARALRTCSACGMENPEGVKFCQECGARLGAPAKAVCPNCSADTPPGTRFCGECGQRLGFE
ncbi:hypothetical protein EUCA11A_02400 [Eubacterium callanderi]|uniref:zinc ribbon domain-containing protein n=1 Tax=Eubacterium callanderi TaxID=53442 RepID=UPI0029FECF9A|nr:zinc ribbon domain-containing protein [Eubacterium callanderi]WPK66116.1 hypothetical protein EUCA2A_02400 [Eubacterium callanderi]WPK70414.1 hypothetical protein EUCA11A_02400 [Eubacterium callanderi]